MNELLSPTARTWAEIDMANLKHNYEIARNTGKKVMCVIKADAYGHGALRCGKYLEKAGADAFAVACLSEALQLRQGGITKTILILGYTSAEYARVLADFDITQTLVDESHALELDKAAQGREAAMQAAMAAERMSRLSHVKVTGMYTHFSVADTPSQDEYTAWQLDNYKTVMDYLTSRGLRPETCHTSNSAAILYHPETQIDMVREGVMLYGMYPDSMPQYGPLKPVMALKTRVSQVRDFPAGTTVSYGRRLCGRLSEAAFKQHHRHHKRRALSAGGAHMHGYVHGAC